ncbi:hypothetical protein GGF41_007191, partial [Coemansia sp. RSA 2531]
SAAVGATMPWPTSCVARCNTRPPCAGPIGPARCPPLGLPLACAPRHSDTTRAPCLIRPRRSSAQPCCLLRPTTLTSSQRQRRLCRRCPLPRVAQLQPASLVWLRICRAGPTATTCRWQTSALRHT